MRIFLWISRYIEDEYLRIFLMVFSYFKVGIFVVILGYFQHKYLRIFLCIFIQQPLIHSVISQLHKNTRTLCLSNSIILKGRKKQKFICQEQLFAIANLIFLRRSKNYSLKCQERIIKNRYKLA